MDGIPLLCPDPCISLTGGIPPDMIGLMADPAGKADGFLERFLFAYPDPMPVPDWNNAGLSDDVADDYRELIDRLWRPADGRAGRRRRRRPLRRPVGQVGPGSVGRTT